MYLADGSEYVEMSERRRRRLAALRLRKHGEMFKRIFRPFLRALGDGLLVRSRTVLLRRCGSVSAVLVKLSTMEDCVAARVHRCAAFSMRAAVYCDTPSPSVARRSVATEMSRDAATASGRSPCARRARIVSMFAGVVVINPSASHSTLLHTRCKSTGASRHRAR